MKPLCEISIHYVNYFTVYCTRKLEFENCGLECQLDYLVNMTDTYLYS